MTHYFILSSGIMENISVIKVVSLVGWLVGWLVGCFGFKRPLETVFQSISDRLSKRGRKRRERIDESKKCPKKKKKNTSAPTACTIGPCPTVIQIVGS